MTTRALLDPGLVQFVDAFPRLDLSPSGRTAWRAASRPAASSPSRPDVETSEVLVPRAGDEGPVRVLVSRPVKLPGPPLPAIVWLHGGGFVIGSPEQDQRLLERIAGEFVWDHPTNAAAWGALLGESVGTPGVSPLAAPARAADLSKVAPALVVVGALDLLVDEAVVYASRLVRAGVPTTLHLYAGAVHGTLDASGTAPGEAMRIELVTALQVALLSEVHHRAPRNGSAEVHQPAHREPRIRRLS